MKKFLRTGVKKKRGGRGRRILQAYGFVYAPWAQQSLAVNPDDADHEHTITDQSSRAQQELVETPNDSDHETGNADQPSLTSETVTFNLTGQLPIHLRRELESEYKQTVDPSVIEKKDKHIKLIESLGIPPHQKHWNIIPNDLKMPCAYHPDRKVAAECMVYCFSEANKYMMENNCGWTPEAFRVAEVASAEFKSQMVPLLFPEWAGSAQNY